MQTNWHDGLKSVEDADGDSQEKRENKNKKRKN
jgi:DNA replication protein DnaD